VVLECRREARCATAAASRQNIWERGAAGRQQGRRSADRRFREQEPRAVLFAASPHQCWTQS
jgi:hypothetical protein